MGERAPGKHTPLWRNRDYLLLWSGQAVSVTGTSASSIAFPLLVLFLTRSPFQAGLVGALDTVPFLLLGLPAGALVDRWNRKWVMIVCDSIRTLALASIPATLWAGHLSIVLIYAVTLLDGTCFAFYNLAEVSALPQVVTKEQLSQASANNNVMWAIGSLAGPPLGGFLYGLSRALPFAADAVSYGASVLSLFAIRRQFQGERTIDSRPLGAQIKEGVLWVWRQPLVRFFGLIGTAQSLAFGGVPLAVIVLARDSFHASSSTIGFTFGVAAVGGVVGAILAGWLLRRLSLSRAALGSLWAGAVFYPALAASPNLPVLIVFAFILFLTSPLYDIVQFSYRMARIPDELQGRVNSVYRIMLWAGQPAGRLAGGALIQVFSARFALGMMGLGMVLIAVAASLNRDLRQTSR